MTKICQATNLACAIEATNGSKTTYDANMKHLLADKQILARILKYTMDEFQDMELEDIIACIGDDIEVGIRPVDAGLSNLGRVKGTATEDNIPGEGAVFYDIRFTAFCPKLTVKILINIEAQKSSDQKKLGYHLENRITFYLARMISSQKQTEFFHSDYDSIKKVRSIWICMNNDETGDSIEEISFTRKTIFGHKENPYNPDLMKGIIINIRNRDTNRTEPMPKSGNALISMLEELLSAKESDEKKRILAEDYGMIMTVELEGRIQSMCNLSDNILERGIAQERLAAIGRMVKANATKEQILSYGYTEDEYAQAGLYTIPNIVPAQ